MDLQMWTPVIRVFLFPSWKTSGKVQILIGYESTIFIKAIKSISEIPGISEMFHNETLHKLKWLCKIQRATENLKKTCRGTYSSPELFMQA